ncbi:MAG TPA: hypothetical protein PKA64_04450, partial [Myxococcota bacterium]|nr:hypothetical protein [Myxococcota bacterium]
MPPARAGILLSELCHVVEALRSLRGRVVTKAWVPRPHLTLLEVGGVVLRIEAAPVPRVHPTAARPPSPPKPLSFQGLLRARLVGRPFELAMPFEDRVIEVRTPEGALHARLFGAGGGVWWVEGDRVVAASHGPSGPLPPLLDRGVTDAAPRFAPEGDETWPDAARRWFEASTAAGESVDRLAAA